jgi:hypothetical protein
MENATPMDSTGSESNESAELNLEGLDTEHVAEPVVEPWRAAKHKVKVDGQEMEVDYDTLLKDYQTSKAAQQRFNEAAQTRKQAEEILQLFKQDPRKALTHPSIGVDLNSFAQQILAEQIEEAMLSPEQREARDMKKKLSIYEQQEQQQRERVKAEQEEQLRVTAESELSSTVMTALQSGGLPNTPATVTRIATYMYQAYQQGFEATPEQIINHVKNGYMDDVKTLLGSSPEETLLAILGPDVVNKIVKSQLNKVKKGQAKQLALPTTLTERNQPNAKPARMSREEYFESLKKKIQD